ncbi:hypothetical protein KDA_14350 [Dictyobacter alpinus]|uniref:Zinc-ribbon domain-containing protein n=1 Tax=Dictyobacter alpinus TaxID=2014873 RepID=A0A402B3M6_9CHLR|nr:hypothetical protein [Dictyobacter alpinus]GCE25951.1 hypothetical protein KDA_14350 [Dictyobacter alpinus]
MRCPYCGGLNPDNSSYCIRCGRNFAPQQQNVARPGQQRAVYPPNPTRTFAPSTSQPQPQPQPQRSVYPPVQARQPERPTVTPRPPQQANGSEYYPPAPAYPPVQDYPPVQAYPPIRQPAPPRRATKVIQENGWPVEKSLPPAPEPPVPFPVHTLAQLKKLAEGALDYKVLSVDDGYGQKKIIRILFSHCVQWQQVATLVKAFSEHDDKKFETIVIQGVYNQERNVYEYTNGQLIFDRNVRLGSQNQQRFQIETDNGYSMEALRIVLSE